MTNDEGLTREFSLYWWDREDTYYPEMRFVTAKEAMTRAGHLANGPAALIGMVKRIMVTDGGDCCVFEWLHDKGVVWPPEKEIRDAGLRREN